MNFKDLKENTHYLIRFKPKYSEDNIYRVSIETKGDKACLLVVYNENTDTVRKTWHEYSNSNFHELIEDLTPIMRNTSIADLLMKE